MLNYINETRGEMKHVSWPTRNQVITLTILVIVLSVLVSFFLGLFDGIFKQLLETYIINR